MFTKNLRISKYMLDEFVANPVELLLEVIRTIDSGSRSALAIVFIRGGSLPSPMTMTDDEEKAVILLGGSPDGVRNALNALNGSLLNQIRQGSRVFWRFKHPTIRDAFASLVAEDRELMDIYLAGTPIEKLFGEVSCGDVGIEGVKVIVPSDRYDSLMTRIESFYKNRRENGGSVNRFLAYRCEREFLERFIARNQSFIADLHVFSYLYAVSDVDVIVRLHECGLLPEEKRLSVVTAIRSLAVETPDAGFMRERIRRVLTEEEVQEILEHVRTGLLPHLDDHIDDWCANHNGDDDPEDYFDELKRALETYRDAFTEREVATDQIDVALERLKDVIEKIRAEMPQEPDSDDFDGSSARGGAQDELRSIFDDVLLISNVSSCEHD